MDEFEIRSIIYDNIKEICHFSQMQVFATSSYQKNYFQLQIDEAISSLINIVLADRNDTIEASKATSMQIKEQQTNVNNNANDQETGNREITPEELAYNDGSDGKSAYVAVNGNVYDVSMKGGWGGGTHFGLYAGHDLSNEFMNCHNGMVEILQTIPKIGVLKENR